jgi:hypothetical protein
LYPVAHALNRASRRCIAAAAQSTAAPRERVFLSLRFTRGAQRVIRAPEACTGVAEHWSRVPAPDPRPKQAFTEIRKALTRVPTTSHSLPTMRITLPLEARPPPHDRRNLTAT